MDIQHALLSKIVLNQDVTTAITARINSDFFTDDRHLRVWKYIIDYWGKYGESPDEAVMKLAFPSYEWKDYSQPIGYFIEALRKRRQRAIFTDMLNNAARLLQATDEPDAEEQLHQLVNDAIWQARTETAPTLDQKLEEESSGINLDDSLEDRMDSPGMLRGISTGIQGIDRVTGGFQPQQFIVLIGLPKSLKSSLLLYMAWQAHRQAKSPLFIGFEMTNQEQMDRLLSLISEFSLGKILNGQFTPRQKRQMMWKFRELQQGVPFTLSTDLESATTVSGLQAKIREYIPDVVFIDGAYLMMSEIPKVEQGSPQALTDIARSLKKLAQTLCIPIVVTTQASIHRAKGGQLNPYSAMYTQAWQQSADVLLGVERVVTDTEENDQTEVPIKVRVLNSRSGPRTDTHVVWDWSRGSVTELDRDGRSLRTGTEDEDT
jgi:replicative DNA helicase